MSIRYKLLIIIIAIILIVSGLIGYSSSRLMERYLLDQFNARLQVATEEFSDKIRTFLNLRKEIVIRISKNKTASLFLFEPKVIEKLQMQDLLVTFAYVFHEISIINVSGREVVKVSDGWLSSDHANVSEKGFFNEARDKGFSENMRYSPTPEGTGGVSPEIGSRTILYAARVLDPFDEFAGMVCGQISYSMLQEALGELEVGEDLQAYIIDNKGYYISHPDPAMIGKAAIKDDDLARVQKAIEPPKDDENGNLATAGDKELEVMLIKLSGETNFVTAAPINEEGWIVLSAISWSEFRTRLERFNTLILFLTLLVILIGIPIALLTASGIANPIQKLVQVTDLMAKGDFSKKVDISSRDEVGTLATSFNIMSTELYHTIKLREQAQKRAVELRQMAEEASKSKSQFLANMSHEIRTPMNAVIGFSELLKNTELTSMQNDYVDTIMDSGGVLLTLISDILDISKIEAGEVQLEHIDFDLEHLVDSTFKIISSRARDKNIKLFYNFQPGMPTRYKGDPTRIRQILLNLLSNAVKFTDEGNISADIKLKDGAVAVSPNGRTAGDVDVGEHAEIFISVNDTGIGIPKERQDDIFNSFTQADSSTTRKYGGTGLGLAISKALVEKMGGKIWIESEAGKGSSFMFTITLRRSASVASEDIVPVELEYLKGKKVFIVDDSKDVQRILEDFC
ncbi:MAG: ATP-binding protein, partial [Candidatus Omnitrophica bacterium]|nr:ATP-binding protein [Candidatus Omnitrophota bacterium]